MAARRAHSILWFLAGLLGLAAVLFHYKSYVKGNLIALSDLPYLTQSTLPLSLPVEPRLVAHAGGAVRGHTYTNSREALDEHYAGGYRVFELDFEWTTDSRLVLVHDWAETSASFGTAPHVFSYDEFVKGTRRDGLHQLTFEGLQEWLHRHRDAFVVTDTKWNNGLLLAYLGAHGQDVLPQSIVQIYRMSELQAARQLKPRAVWFTAYKSSYPSWALSRVSGVDAIVIPVSRYDRYYDPDLMRRVHFYAHSIPADSVGKCSERLKGIYGFYVD